MEELARVDRQALFADLLDASPDTHFDGDRIFAGGSVLILVARELSHRMLGNPSYSQLYAAAIVRVEVPGVVGIAVKVA